MKVAKILPWIAITTLALLQICLADKAVYKSNSTKVFNRKDTSQDSRIPHRSLSWRNVKFPVRPPRLRTPPKPAKVEPQLPMSPVGNNGTTTTVTTSTTTAVPTILKSDRDQLDIDSSASSHHVRSVVWPVRLRPAVAKRFRAPTPTTPEPQVLQKLLQPKPTRPAIYSLDGFVPKPSIKKIGTTQAPRHYGKTDLQVLSSVIRKKKINRFSKEEEDDDYENETPITRRKKPVSHYTAFARKGVPGQDYPVLSFIPQTDFHCGTQLGPGLYADHYTNCQVWHMCPGGNLSPRHSFLCPNGTIFDQRKRICDWWYNVDCQSHLRKERSTLELILNGPMDIEYS